MVVVEGEVDQLKEDAPVTPTPAIKENGYHMKEVTPLTVDPKRDSLVRSYSQHASSPSSPTSQIETPKEAQVLPEGWDTEESRQRLAEEFRQERDRILQEAKGDVVLTVDDLTKAGADSKSSKKFTACLIEGSSKTLDELAADVSQSTSMNQITTRNEILALALRKITGLEDDKCKQADLLTDTTGSYLWRWEVREMKIFPPNLRPIISAARKKRALLSERLRSLQAAIDGIHRFVEGKKKAFHKLLRASQWVEKTSPSRTIAPAIHEEKQKLLSDIEAKDLERQRKDEEREALRLKKEEEKEAAKARREEERLNAKLKREAERQEKERLKQEARRQKEEEKRKAREEIVRAKADEEYKKKRILAKQQAFFARFKKSENEDDESADSPASASKQSPNSKQYSDSNASVLLFTPPLHRPPQRVATTEHVDAALIEATKHQWTGKELLKDHLVTWKRKRRLNRMRSKCGAGHYWQCRRRNKDQASWEPIYTIPGKDANEDRGPTNEFAEQDVMEVTSTGGGIFGSRMPMARYPVRKLLQFEENLRPPYFGSWSKESGHIKARKYLAKDPSLDYDVESDLEWEEPEDGEDIGDSDAENEDDNDGYEDEEGDGFVVPDNYMSDCEYADDMMETDAFETESGDQQVPNWASKPLQRAFNAATDRARKCRGTLVVSNSKKIAIDLPEGDGDDQRTLAMIVGDSRLLLGFSVENVYSSPMPVKMYDQEQERKEREERRNAMGRRVTTLPVETLKDLVRFLQVNRKLKINRATAKFVDEVNSGTQQDDSAGGITKASVKRKINEIASFEKGEWHIKADLLEKLGLVLLAEIEHQQRDADTATVDATESCNPAAKVASTGDPFWCSLLQTIIKDSAKENFLEALKIFSEDNLPKCIEHMPASVAEALLKSMHDTSLGFDMKTACARCLGNIAMCLQTKTGKAHTTDENVDGKRAQWTSIPPRATLQSLCQDPLLLPALRHCLESKHLPLVRQATRLLLSLLKASRANRDCKLLSNLQEEIATEPFLALLAFNMQRKGSNVAAHSAAVLNELLVDSTTRSKICCQSELWKRLVVSLCEAIKPGPTATGIALPKYAFLILATNVDDKVVLEILKCRKHLVETALGILRKEDPNANLALPVLKFLLMLDAKEIHETPQDLTEAFPRLKQLNRREVTSLVAEMENKLAQKGA